MTSSKYHTIGAKLVMAFATTTLLLMIVSLVSWTTWNSLDRQVSALLTNSVPAYNTSFVLESRSAEIRHLVVQLSLVSNKTSLDELMRELSSELETIEAALRDNTSGLAVSYLDLMQQIEQYAALVSARIDQNRQLKLLDEQLSWIHQDIVSELKPMRQEVQWQLQRSSQPEATSFRMEQWNLIQSILDEEEDLFALTRDLLHARHQSQVNNGLKVVGYKLSELSELSQPIFVHPSAIAYQQLLDDLHSLLTENGPFHTSLVDKVLLEQSLAENQTRINDSLEGVHQGIAGLVLSADRDFRQVKKDTAGVIAYGNHVLVVCFSLSILISLFLTYYFVNRRIVRRLNTLSQQLDAITDNQLETPFVPEGRDEISRLSSKLETLRQTLREIERTNAINLLNNTSACLITCDVSGVVESMNSSAADLLGGGVTATPKRIWQWLPSGQAQVLEHAFSALEKTENDSVTLSLGSQSRPNYLRFYMSLYRQGGGQKVIITITDITEQAHANYLLELRVAEKTHSLQKANDELLSEIEVRREAEKHLKKTQSELIQAAKMAVVGQTMTTMAHELNQPLSALSTYLFSARMALEQSNNESVASALDHIESLSARMSKLVNSLRHFARKSPGDSDTSDVALEEVIEQTLTLISTKAKRQQTRLSYSVPDGLMVRADAMSLEQVLINLFANGIDAVSEQIDREVSLEWLGSQNGFHTIAISDNGNGFDPQVVDRLFTPFTTTKEVGLGLGLNICRSLTEKYNGNIFLASSLQRGAMVVLELPYE